MLTCPFLVGLAAAAWLGTLSAGRQALLRSATRIARPVLVSQPPPTVSRSTLRYLREADGAVTRIADIDPAGHALRPLVIRATAR